MRKTMRKQMLFLFPVILILVLAVAQVSFAADEYVIRGERELTFTGSLGPEYANSMLSFIVLKNGKTINDFLAAETQESMLDMLECYKQTTVGGDGNYSVKFSIRDDSNCYNAYIGVEKSANYKELKLYYVKESENEATRLRIKDAKSAADIEQIISDKKYSLNLNYRLLENTDIKKLSEFLFKSNISADAALSTPSETSVKINKAAAITAFSRGAIRIFSDYYECFGVDDELSKYFKLSFMDASAKERIESMLNRNPADFTEFDNDFLVNSVKSIICYADGYGYVKGILLHYADDLGIDRSKVTDEVCKKLIGNIHDNIADAVKAAYDSTLEPVPEKPKKGNGTGGGGTVKVSPITAPVMVPEQATTYTDKVEDFNDLSDAEWARNAIMALAERGVVSGKGDGSFYPNDKVLREEFVKMIMGVFQFAELSGEAKFEDVSDGDWFASYVKNAYLAGIVQGISDSEFGSGKYISRQDMAVILYNALLKKGVILQSENQDTKFADTDKISLYAVNAIDKLSDAKVITGDDLQCFNPLENTTRAEVAEMIYRILPYLNEGVK